MSRWIPVEDRLPEEGIPVLVTAEGMEFPVQIDMYMPSLRDALGMKYAWGYRTVIAWMPLPKPYNPEEPEHPDCASCPVLDVNCYEQCRWNEKKDVK